ncbi:unnamed protein product [Musa acuminata subsp. malaccensis]|uniref:(wild Malaysian banana) hypothetical protein n=1 Tax=Musa acuminata subsp. malaccensis TaxID=214687 RepID=A0A804JEZ7_MUSAM|nr:unnamed protein product [Musa acuminata subsp. malaccensis]
MDFALIMHSAQLTFSCKLGLPYQTVPPGMGGTYRSDRLAVRGPPCTGQVYRAHPYCSTVALYTDRPATVLGTPGCTKRYTVPVPSPGRNAGTVRIFPLQIMIVGGLGPDGASATGSQSDIDSAKTTVFVGGLDPEVIGKQCGFVLFSHRNNAEEALQQLNGTIIGKQIVRLSWGHNPARQRDSSWSIEEIPNHDHWCIIS